MINRAKSLFLVLFAIIVVVTLISIIHNAMPHTFTIYSAERNDSGAEVYADGIYVGSLPNPPEYLKFKGNSRFISVRVAKDNKTIERTIEADSIEHMLFYHWGVSFKLMNITDGTRD